MFSLYPLSISTLAAQTGGNNNTWLWIVLFLVVVFVVWWLLTRATANSGEGIESHHEPHDHEVHAAHPEGEPAQKGAVKAPPADHVPAPEPDDLAILEGIGPKVKSLLAEAGVVTFAQLAEAEVGKLEEILEANRLQFLDPASWPEQARLAAAGKMDELQELMDNLKGGRRVE